MRITGKRRSRRLGPLRVNSVGLRLTSVTLDLGLVRAVLWERRRRR